MVHVVDEPDAEALADALGPVVSGTLFPLVANGPGALAATWQRCADVSGDHLLSVRDGGDVVAAAGVFVEDECRLMALVATSDAAADALLDRVIERHPGTPVSIGIDGTDPSRTDWLRRRGFTLREASTVTRAPVLDTAVDAVRHRPAVGSPWSRLHDSLAGGAWWRADRVAADAAPWICLSDPAGTAYVAARVVGRECEVFVDGGPAAALTTCLLALRSAAGQAGCDRVLYFCEDEQVPAATAADFEVVCHYQDWLLPNP